MRKASGVRVHGRGRGRACALSIGAMVAALAAQASAQPMGEGVILEPPAPGLEGVARTFKSLYPQPLRMAEAVRVDQPVAFEVKTGWSGKAGDGVAAGETLASVAGAPGVFCAPVRQAGLSAVAPCLVDADGDGRFEESRVAGFTSAQADGLAITAKGGLTGVELKKRRALPQPVGYTRLPAAQGPQAKARLMWESYGKRGPTDPVKLRLWLDAGERGAGTQVFGALQKAQLAPDGTGVVTYEGVRIRFMGFEGKSLRYRVEGAAGPRRVALQHQAAPMMITVMLP